MKELNTYILEKLKIGKEVKVVGQSFWKQFYYTYHIEENT